MIDPEEAANYPQPGEFIDAKYRIERLLGVGGMGAVLEATHILRRAPVALKFMSPKLIHAPAVVERFLNEGVAASRIDNEHVVSVLDVSKLPSGQPYLVMEYLEGRDLAKVLASEGQRGLAEIPRCVHFVLQILRGLQIAHAAGIVHRDLKPANCLVVERDGVPDFLKIVDFGISKVNAEPLHLTQVGSALGTPLYVSPEQARDAASVDARSDLYSVSVILYELICGRTPFQPPSGQLSEMFMLLATSQPKCLDEIRGGLPEGLDAAVQKGLAKTPSDRYSSAADMGIALAPFSDGRSEQVLRQLSQRPTSPRGVRFTSAEAVPGTSPLETSRRIPETLLENARTAPPTKFRTGVSPTDTASPTTLPAFLERRQTELLVGVPVLMAIALAALLFGFGGGERRSASGGIAPSADVQRIDLVPAARRESASTAKSPVDRPPSNDVDSARADSLLGAPVVSVEQDIRPVDQPPRTAVDAIGSRGPREKRTREVGSATNPTPSRRVVPHEPRRPSLKQIGIQE